VGTILPQRSNVLHDKILKSLEGAYGKTENVEVEATKGMESRWRQQSV
jgi:hypothetical protein